MSRSRRKRPFYALCGGSQKKAKRCCNRIMRRTNRVILQTSSARVFIDKREALNCYDMPQDGSRRYGPYDGRMDYMRWYHAVLGK